ncbi:MAG: TonB-dependent receptor, partial [Chitinophagia bacterium]|nr:TonB-dependent receptor [Chitinophagia bacterium]
TVNGTVKDKLTGESIIGAVIKIEQLANVVVTSNEYGFYAISLPKGKYDLRISFVGYEEKRIPILLNAPLITNVFLESKNQLTEVVVSSKRKDDNLTKAQIGTETLNMQSISKVPVIFGEKDVLKTIQLLPGVKSAGEGNSGFYVRGGAADQNLILLDEAPVYNASHLLGFFSTFNSDAIKDATLIKGNGPAQYGGRLSSVLDVKMKDGNNKNYTVNGGLGLISSRLSIEGPIQEDKSSFILSGRRTYADVFLKATEKFKDNILYFYDLNAKANYKIDDKNRIYFSGYFGQDELGLGSSFRINWGNKTGTIRWNRIVNNKLFLNTSFIYSDYSYNVGLKNGETNFNVNSNIKDVNLKQDYTYYLNPKNTIRFGFNSILHTITPSVFSGTVNNNINKVGRNGLENAFYFNNNFKANQQLTFDYGLRISAYSIMGGDQYNIYNNNAITQSILLQKNEFGKTYMNAEPRFTSNYRINDLSSFKIAYARNVQHLHLLSNATAASPSDQWIGNSYNIKPELADQTSIGYARNFKNNTYELGAELYYKAMQNQLDYKDGTNINTIADVESALLYGVGRAYGFEFLVKKKIGFFSGWISYTLSKTERKIDGINEGNWYNAKQDRTHDVSIVTILELNSKWTISGVFVYSTGNAVTFPTGKYALGEQTIYQYANRNANRMPDYHRLDLSATYENKNKKKNIGSWNFSLYNVYGRENAYQITFQDDPLDNSKTQIIQTALFRWVPSITYNFKF